MKKNVWKLTLAVAALAGVTLFSSCLNNDDDFTPQPQTGLFLMHAAPGFPGLDISLNKEKITKETFKYTIHGGTTLQPDNYQIDFVSPVSGDTVATWKDSLRNGYSYSAILYDTASAVKLMVFQDQFEQNQSSGSSFLRFLQLSPINSSVTIHIDGESYESSRHFADNVSNPDLAKFKPISGGEYNITALDDNADTLGYLEGAELESNHYYTLYLSGYEEATVDTLKPALRIATTY